MITMIENLVNWLKIYEFATLVIEIIAVCIVLKIIAYPILHPNEPIENALKKWVIKTVSKVMKYGIMAFLAYLAMTEIVLPLIGQIIKQFFDGIGLPGSR